MTIETLKTMLTPKAFDEFQHFLRAFNVDPAKMTLEQLAQMHERWTLVRAKGHERGANKND